VRRRYDVAAPGFERHRALPGHVPDAIRATALGAVNAASRPRLLDLGAGTGRIGAAFVQAGDDYVGVDLSLGMLREFRRRAVAAGAAPRLAQADGVRLPFRDGAFDAVLTIQVMGALDDWRPLVAEARRVLRPEGALVVGRGVMPPDGVDERMKRRLAALLRGTEAAAYHRDAHGKVLRALADEALDETRVVAATWQAERTPRAFLARQPTGARFSALPQAVKAEALRRLGEWAAAEFGSLDAAFIEPHAFELRVFRF
jgi:SAM-dependent methyltransferase